MCRRFLREEFASWWSAFRVETLCPAARDPSRGRKQLAGSRFVRTIQRRLSACAIVLTIGIITGLANAQQAAESPAAASEQAAPVPLVDVATESETVAGTIRDMRTDLSSDRSADTVTQQLPAMTREIDARLRESRKIVVQSPSIEMLRSLEGEWRRVRRELYGLNKDLSKRVYELERYLAQLNDLAKTWDQTLVAAKESSVPPEILGRIESVIGEIRQAREAVEKQRARALTMQTRVGAQDSRAANVLTSIDQAQESALDRLFLPDSAPIWNLTGEAGSTQNVKKETVSSFLRQWAALRPYVDRQAMRFVLAIVVFVVIAGAVYSARRRIRRFCGEQSELYSASRVFEMPIAAALVLSLLGSRWIFPEAPRVLWAVLGGLGLVPSMLILRRRMRSELHPLLYALIAFFVIDQIRALTAAVEFLPRLLFLAEMFGVMIVSLCLVRAAGRPPRTTPDKARSRKTLKIVGYVGLAVSSAAFAANTFGYVTLAALLGNALLQSSYLGAILYGAVEVLDGLFAVALSLRPFAALGTVSRHGLLLRRRVRLGLQSAAVFLWVLAILQRLLLRERIILAGREFLAAKGSFGSINVSLGDVLAFVVTVWAAFLVSRFVRFLLDEDVYPRVGLKRGLPYAISNTLHYLILVAGFFLAVAALGFDMTRVTILAGAFSVGVGFGLQNIFNNFISGLILLFERPINIGDVVQIDDASGVVERIGVRASIIRTTNGSEIIMPNGKLISERLINWTLSSRQHGIELPIAVAQGTDPGRVIELLEKTAAAHPLVTGDPPPQALVVKLGPDSFGFELRAWTDRSELWMQIRSDLAIAISSTLAAEKIAIR
jgi:potassium-dependent mechanosensitive channel